MKFRIVGGPKRTLVSTPQDMEVSAEEFEYVLNAVLQKSKCRSHRGQGSLERKSDHPVRALPGSVPWSIRPADHC